jgi:hypothetical protein
MTTIDTRMAYIAREPNQPGAVAYINAEIIHTPGAQRLVEGWIERGHLVQKVTLTEAIAEFCRYSAAPPRPAIEHNVAAFIGLGGDEPLPIMLRKQAD